MRTFAGSALVFSCTLLAAVAVLSVLHAQASPSQRPPSVEKVEPPSWWAKHTINPVRLLVRGKNLFGARVRSRAAAIQASDPLVNASGTYLFVNLRIGATARPGPVSLTVTTAQGETTIPFRIEPPTVGTNKLQGITADDVIYLIMTDRFANGDPANDRPSDSPPGANDRKNPRGFHGGDFRGVINRLPYLKDLGVTALWLTPWYDNWNGLSQCDKPWCPHTYYHGYHAIDYYAVEDRFGDFATLKELVDQSHKLGIKIIQDQVANHVGSRHPWVQNSPLDNWFHGTLSSHQLNSFNNSVLVSPHANPVEIRNVLDGWFSDDLPDMNQEHPEVSRYEIQNSLWWIGITGADGIRQDTLQYMPRSFIRQLSDALDRQYPGIWMVGEVFDRDAVQTSFFMGGQTGWDGVDTRLDSVFDFPLWNSSVLVFTNKLPVRALRDQLKNDALYPDPTKLTAMQNNHDTTRFMSLEGATLEGAMLHMAFTLSVRGTTQIYSGEEIAMEGGHDPDNRRDFPGGFPGDSRNAFEASGRTANQQRMFDWTRRWIRLRAEHSALRRGRLHDLLYDEHSYVFARQDNSETVIVAFNRSNEEKRIEVPAGAIGLRDGTSISSLVGTVPGSRVAAGKASLVLPPRSAVAVATK